MTFSKYITHQLDLSMVLVPIQHVRHPGHYCVLWYRSVPLRETYHFCREGIIFVDNASFTDETRKVAEEKPGLDMALLSHHDAPYQVSISAVAINTLICSMRF